MTLVSAEKKDLLVLVADRNMEAAVEGILSRCKSLNIRKIEFDIRRHPEKDSGCRVSGVEYLKPFINQYNYAIIVFDLEGCGLYDKSVDDIECIIEDSLKKTGWDNNAAVIVIEPELDIWVWSDSPHVDEVLGWSSNPQSLSEWLVQHGLREKGQIKPARPKEALEAALKYVRKPRSSSIYLSLAEKVSLHRCSDKAFEKLKTTLCKWFSN
jgi:hypothetical protein